ncbi:MAG: hypothetical protein E7396_09440 [Ruminococcaceae bacterium]|nr:hypothetical protein [Oscillospiraceae bacterium]
MELLRISSLPSKRKNCTIQVTDEQFTIQGHFYYLVNKEFRKSKTKSGSCSVKEYLGLATLRKRSPRKTLFFMAFAVILEIVDTIAGKINDIFFFADTSWTDYVVNTVIVLCILLGLRAFFSKKKVIEISFVSKRFCVDEKLFAEDDIDKLDRVLMKLR